MQDLISKIHTLLELHDYQAAETHLQHLASSSKLRDHLKSGIDIETAFKDIREVINSHMEKADREIRSSESYPLVRQRLDQVKSISSNLQSHLSEPNKAVLPKLEQYLQERVKQQHTDISSQINTFAKEGNHFVESKDKYLADLLAHNLSVMSEVDQLFQGCTHYQSSTDALNKVLAHQSYKFTTEISKAPTSPDLSLSFKVLKGSVSHNR